MVKRGTRVAGVALIGLLGVAYDPYMLVRAQFERQRINAGLDEVEVAAAGHMALMEQPRAVANAVVELIERGQPR